MGKQSRETLLTVSHGILAQLGEHLPYKQRVTGSSPVGPIFAETAKYFRRWRNSSVGESTRFIPVVSGVQIPLPLFGMPINQGFQGMGNQKVIKKVIRTNVLKK